VAQRVQTFFVDDIDGTDAEGTVRFGLDGTDYEIDLNVKHSEQLHRTLAPYLAHARKTAGARRSAAAPGAPTRTRSANGPENTASTSRNAVVSRRTSWTNTARHPGSKASLARPLS
jgi:hypothetical protein